MEEVQMEKVVDTPVEKAADVQAGTSAEDQMGGVTEQDDTMTEEENVSGALQRRKTQSIIALKKAVTEAKVKEQKRRYHEAMKWRRATEMDLGDVDLEQEMEQAAETEEASEVTTAMTMVTTTTLAASSSRVVVAEVYAKPYTKMTESRGEHSMPGANRERLRKKRQGYKDRRRKKTAWQKKKRQGRRERWYSVHCWRRKKSHKKSCCGKCVRKGKKENIKRRKPQIRMQRWQGKKPGRGSTLRRKKRDMWMMRTRIRILILTRSSLNWMIW